MSEMSTMSPKLIEVGDTAPDFSLPSAQGGEVRLQKLVQSGPALLWFSQGMV